MASRPLGDPRLLAQILTPACRVLIEEFLDDFSLSVVELFRHSNANGDVEVPRWPLSVRRNAFPPESQARAAIRPRRHLQADPAIERREIHLGAGNRLRDRDGHIERQVPAVSLEGLVLLHMNASVEVSRWTSGDSLASFAGKTNAGTFFNAGRNPNLKGFAMVAPFCIGSAELDALFAAQHRFGKGKGQSRFEIGTRLGKRPAMPASAAAKQVFEKAAEIS